MINYYAQAIDVLKDEKTDFRAIAFEVAKLHPKAIAQAAERIEIGFGWQKECTHLMEAGLKVNAIKRCREITGMGLAEAKSAVEALV